MKEVFIKKYWDEEDILYYLHFQDGYAVRQIEISGGNKMCYDVSDPVQGSSVYDQALEELELDGDEFITGGEFEKAWEK
ncbi:hypothetical protein R1T16_05555 [Flavobacterium sp. DG1-102-2]|uniref:hypothetical protein n=1 Tax=Flavobacterium sp. DG1-102-2 TaxID=3081663 RepID=UPI00294911CF|nr:hypothetical protein [Flavobacterium sp. DG1-102-2]MDV6167881.1 hypothetical protein [Flavobacterium sp. DG1-102-2]